MKNNEVVKFLNNKVESGEKFDMKTKAGIFNCQPNDDGITVFKNDEKIAFWSSCDFIINSENIIELI